MKTQKYLQRHCEPEALDAALRNPPASFDYVLVLPCFDESIEDLLRFTQLCAASNALLIVVVNQPQSVTSCENNTAVVRWLAPDKAARGQCVHWCNSDGATVLLIDRVQTPVADNEGVGLARKIGADCAYALIDAGVIKSPWIFSTDADAHLPADYFAAPAAHSGCSAVIYPFEHIACGDTAVDLATTLYELRLNHYVAGLRRAGSPYAFHTLGSTIAMDAKHYAAAHGFPKRAGGEDFYLLNKLAKLAPVHSLQQPLLQLRARASHRVPFGTGPAVQKLTTSADMLLQPLFYHDESFDVLGSWLAFFTVCGNRLYDNADGDWREWLPVHAGAQNAQLLLQVIDGAEFESTLAKARRQCRNAIALQRYLHTWFDGFRALKLLHALRDLQFPLQSFRERFGDIEHDPQQTLASITALNR